MYSFGVFLPVFLQNTWTYMLMLVLGKQYWWFLHFVSSFNQKKANRFCEDNGLNANRLSKALATRMRGLLLDAMKKELWKFDVKLSSFETKLKLKHIDTGLKSLFICNMDDNYRVSLIS